MHNIHDKVSVARIFAITAAVVFAVTDHSLAAEQNSTSNPKVELHEIGPQRSSLHSADPDGASGGRVNGTAIAASEPNVMYAASEWGGLFRSSDRGQNWTHIPGHVPVGTWDVKVDPTDSRRVFATSFYDGRVQSRAGINISIDSGVTWSKPESAAPPTGFCEDEARREEPSAFGISIDPANPNEIYIGTNCGVAISHDRGATWKYSNPMPEGGGSGDVWSIVVHHDGILDACGDAGHRRSPDRGMTWTGGTGSNQLPAGRCSLAVSPAEPAVVFAVVGTTIYETHDGGTTWAQTYVNPSPQGRIPFVAINKRSGLDYDLWFGDVGLYRAACTTPHAPVLPRTPRCQTSNWAGSFSRSAGGHDDLGSIIFDPSAATDACPLLYASDGGVYLNTRTASPDCHTPRWTQPTTTPRALWQWDMKGVHAPGLDAEYLYFGNQDDGTFGTVNAGSNSPTWTNQHCCDGMNVAADEDRVLSTVCCWSGGRATRLWISAPGMVGSPSEIQKYPEGTLRAWEQLGNLSSFGRGKYIVLTSAGVFVTLNIAASPLVWTKLGPDSTPASPCGIQVSTSRTGQMMLFVKSGGCNGETGGSLWRYVGVSPGGIWTMLRGSGQFGVYAVDPTNPNRILAADLGRANGPEMVMTTDGGATWSPLPSLNAMMIGQGTFRAMTRRGPLRWTSFGAYPQPTLIAFDPADANTIAAAGADSGVFLSRDGGMNWLLLTDPDNPQSSGRSHIPRARYVHFDHDEPSVLRMYIGTQGRGVWRIRVGADLEPAVAGTVPPNPQSVAPPPAVYEQPDIARPAPRGENPALAPDRTNR